MFIITILTAILGLIATDIFVPSLPSIAIAFHQSFNHTELTISLFLVGFAISQLFYGPISDYTGRKAPLITGVFFFTLGSFICIVASSFNIFCLGRIIQGIGVGAGLSLARVIIRDCYTGTAIAVKTSQMAVFVALTPAVAPFIGGLLQHAFGFRSVFIFLFAYGILLLFLLTFYLKETIHQKEETLHLKHIFKTYHQLFRNFCFMRYVILSGLAFSAVILYANVVPFIIQNQMHLSARTNGTILLLAALGLCVSCFVNSRIVAYTGPKKLLLIGMGLLTLSGILLILSEYLFGLTLITLIPLMFLVTFACGFMFPNAVAMAFHNIHVKIGVAGALYGFFQISTSTLMNLLLNIIPNQGQIVLGIFYVALGICGLGLLKSYSKNEN